MKSYTDLSQSKKLAEILPIDSADMWWSRCTITDFGDDMLKVSYTVEPCNISQFRNTKEDIPCWSLAALMKLISKANDFDEKDLICSSKGYRYEMYYKKAKPNDIQMHNGKCCDNPLDAAFDVVCWLKENNEL